MMQFVREKPGWAEMSEHLCEKAEGYIIIMLTGRRYCIAVTPDFKKVFGVSRDKDHLYCKRGSDQRVEKVIRSIIDSVYLQVRDTIGAQISGDLSQQLTDFLEDKCYPAIAGAVQNRMNQALLQESSGFPGGARNGDEIQDEGVI